MKIVKFIAAAAVSLAALAPAGAAAQQRHSTQWRTKSAEADTRRFASDEAAREFAVYSRCVADKRYDRARAVVLAPYGSREQSKLANGVAKSDEDRCLKGGFDDMRMRFGADVLAGGLGQALVLKDYPDLPALVGASPVDPAVEAERIRGMNAAELFGRCVVQRDPAAALALFAAFPATRDEVVAVNRLRDDLGQCLAAGSTITINEMFLRNSMGVAAYRLAQQIQPRGSGGGAAR